MAPNSFHPGLGRASRARYYVSMRFVKYFGALGVGIGLNFTALARADGATQGAFIEQIRADQKTKPAKMVIAKISKRLREQLELNDPKCLLNFCGSLMSLEKEVLTH